MRFAHRRGGGIIGSERPPGNFPIRSIPPPSFPTRIYLLLVERGLHLVEMFLTCPTFQSCVSNLSQIPRNKGAYIYDFRTQGGKESLTKEGMLYETIE